MMIWIPVLGISFIAFILEVWYSWKYRKARSRSGITGGDAARHLLDASGSSQMMVECADGKNKSSRNDHKRLLLERSVYDGKTLTAIATASRQTILNTRIHTFSDSTKPFWRFFQMLIFVSWLILFANLFYFHRSAIQGIVRVVFGITFIFGFLNLPRDWEASEHAYLLLKQSGYFDVDELFRLKNILKSARFDTLAQIFKSPFDLLTALAGRKGK